MRGMRFIFLLLIVSQIAMPKSAFAQKGKYTFCRESFFTNSEKVSTRVCFDSLGRFGVAKAYRNDGKEIYFEKEIRFKKHAQTFFTYFPNGAVYKANYRVVQEDGVHWTNTIYEFSSKGKLIVIKEEGKEDKN